jgi:hypothetical protein
VKIVGGNPLILEARDEETVTVAVNDLERPGNVRYNLDGSPWSGGCFVVRKAAHPDGRRLLVQIDCGPVEPGEPYTIVLAGDPDTDVSTWTVKCRQAPIRQVLYTIDVR